MGCARSSADSARRSTRPIIGLLDNAGTDNERQRMLHSAICYLRDELRGWSNLQVERVLFDGLNLVALSNTTSQMQHRLLLDENYLRLLGVGEQASIAFDLASLRDALVKGLPSAGVRTAYLACVAGHAKDMLRSAMCLRDGELVESEDAEYPASQLLPPGALARRPAGELPRLPAGLREPAAGRHRLQLLRRHQRLRGVPQRDRGRAQEHPPARGAGAEEHAARAQRAGAGWPPRSGWRR